MVYYNVISELIINILHVMLIKKMMELFLPADDTDEKKLQAGFFVYYLLTSVLFEIFHISVIYEIGNYLGIIGLTFFYQGAWKKRVWTSLVIFSLDMTCSLAVYFAFAQKIIVDQQAIQTLLFLICVTVISHMAYPADSREVAFDKRQTGILIVIPGASIFMLCILLYGKSEDTAALLICISILMINLGVFYLYHMMAENYKNIRENDLYRQQTYAYQNQLDVIMESQSRIRALKHDMKNHILALQMLLRKKDWEEADRYLNSMQDFMANPAEYIITGNEAIDSLLNYKLQRANDILNTVEARINIPEKLMLHSFDINMVLGNLLDNAIEGASQTEEKKLKIEMKLEKGILYLNVRNSCKKYVSLIAPFVLYQSLWILAGNSFINPAALIRGDDVGHLLSVVMECVTNVSDTVAMKYHIYFEGFAMMKHMTILQAFGITFLYMFCYFAFIGVLLYVCSLVFGSFWGFVAAAVAHLGSRILSFIALLPRCPVYYVDGAGSHWKYLCIFGIFIFIMTIVLLFAVGRVDISARTEGGA